MERQSLAFGTLLGGRYRIERSIGAGAMGAVYEAMQDGLGRKVAIKVLHGNLAPDRDAITRFQREAQSAAALGHPNIVQVIDFQWPQNEPPFIVMEHLVGRSLADAIHAEGRIDGVRAARIARQIASALLAAHNAGIVHRDIKPDNVFLVDVPGVGEVAKVLDFGIAKLDRRTDAQLTSDGTMLGSPAYMAPEQARGGVIDPRSDIFALGSTLYRMLSGKLPFDAPSLNALLFAITEQLPAPLSQIAPGLDPRLYALVDRAMQKDPNARFQSAGEIGAALEAVAAGSSISGAASYSIPAPNPYATAVSGPPVMTGMSAAPSPYAPAPMMMSAPPMQKSSGAGAVIAILVAFVALLLVAGGAGAAFFLVRAQASNVPTAISATPAAPAVPSASNALASVTDPSAPQAPGALMPSKNSGNSHANNLHDAGNLSIAPNAPTPGPSAPATPGGAPAAMKQTYSGNNPQWGGGSYNNFTIDAARPVIEGRMPFIRSCYVPLTATAPDHQFSYYRFRVQKDGRILAFLGGPDGASAERLPMLDSCVAHVLIGTSIGKAIDNKDGEITVSITARTPDNP